jgi:hypothetical protein
MQEMEAGTTGERGKEMQDQQERETLKDSIRVRLYLEDRSLEELLEMRDGWALNADELECVNEEIAYAEDELASDPQAEALKEEWRVLADSEKQASR